jgi:pimeloyl-ACP methyl ester carboxylesterase
VVLVGHSQGGILAAALASDPAFTRRHRVTHVVTSGAPVGLLPVPPITAVLSVERGDDPVPRLDLTPNPARPSWVTVRTPSTGPAVDVGAHRLEGYVATLRVAEGAPRGTVDGLDAWQASAGGVLGRPVRSVSEVVIERAAARAERGVPRQT